MKSERAMAHRPKLIDLHDNTPEGAWMAIKRQVDADAEYSRIEIESLKETVNEQNLQLTKLRTLVQGHELKFNQVKLYTEKHYKKFEEYKQENEVKFANTHERIQTLDTGIANELLRFKDEEVQAKLVELNNKVETNVTELYNKIENYKGVIQYIEEVVRPDDGKAIKAEFAQLYNTIATVTGTARTGAAPAASAPQRQR